MTILNLDCFRLENMNVVFIFVKLMIKLINTVILNRHVKLIINFVKIFISFELTDFVRG